MGHIISIFLVFGGATGVGLAFSPIGRALADRIRRRGGLTGPDPAAQEELARLRDDVAELQERLEFTERVLAQREGAGPGAGGTVR
ncbi:MAG TPA: hypothetical protein VI297_02245 [Gemmatimonadales bacterium]